MVNIRKFEKKKENTEQERDFSKKILLHRLTVFYRAVLSILLAAALLAALYISNKNKVYTEYQVVSSVNRDKVESAFSMNLDGTILTYSSDGANCVDVKGNALWNQTFEMQNPIVKVNKDIAAMADYNGRVIYIMDKTGLVGQIETGMPIRSICISQDGVTAAVLDDSGVNAIYLYNNKGDTIAYFKTTMEKSGYPLAVEISPNSEIVAVSYLYLDSGIVKSNIGFYNFGDVGQNQTDNYVSGYSYDDAIIPEIDFLNNDTSFALSDSRLVIYKGKQIPTSQAEILLKEEIQSVFYSQEYIGLVYLTANSDAKYRLDIYNSNGKLQLSEEINMDYKEILFKNDCVIIYNEKECLITNMKGKVKFQGSLSGTIETMIPTDQLSQYIVVSPDKIARIELK